MFGLIEEFRVHSQWGSRCFSVQFYDVAARCLRQLNDSSVDGSSRNNPPSTNTIAKDIKTLLLTNRYVVTASQKTKISEKKNFLDARTNAITVSHRRSAGKTASRVVMQTNSYYINSKTGSGRAKDRADWVLPAERLVGIKPSIVMIIAGEGRTVW